MDLSHKYEYRCEIHRSHGMGWMYLYIIIGRHGAIHLHFTEYDEDRIKQTPALAMPCGGLEAHYREPPDYMKDQAPSHSPCQILGQPCWHDGTSLYASETLYPLWKDRRSEPEVFEWLVREMGRFEREVSDDDI
jgi:hypothetical protein